MVNDIENVSISLGSSGSGEHPLVRQARLLRIKANKLMEAYEAVNSDLTKFLLSEVELDLDELVSANFEEISVDQDYERISSIVTDCKETVKLVNNAINFASGLSSSYRSFDKDQLEDIKVKLKPFFFSGELKEWRSFWDRFNANIHSKKKMEIITKFTFLLECLKGGALEVVKGLEITVKNYEVAILRLRSRYDDPKKLVVSYYEELRQVEHSDASFNQRGNFDTIQKLLKNLESVGIVIDHDILRMIIMSKFSRDTLRNTLRHIKRNPDRSFSVENLMIAIDETLLIEEDIDVALVKETPLKKSETKVVSGSFVGGHSSKARSSSSGPIRKNRRKECIFCSETSHKSEDCVRFGSLASRRAALSKKDLCHRCLGKNHIAKNCSTSPVCTICKKLHLSAMCVNHMIAMSEKRKANKAKALNEKKGTFLQTFFCKIRNPSNPRSTIEVRGLLDPGSLHSYVNERICRALKLRINDSVSLACYRFGSSDTYDINTHSVELELVNNQSQSRFVSLTSSPCITGKFRTCPDSTLVKHSLPKDLVYADPDIFEENQKTLDILIGGDHYNDFVDLNQIKKLDNGILLLKSIFGWIPMGAITSVSRSTTSTLLSLSAPKSNSEEENIIAFDAFSESDTLELCDISKFWSLEMVGIKPSELENDNDKVIDHFRRTSRIVEGRYEVCWPWKLLNPELPSNYRMARARLRTLVASSDLTKLTAYNNVFKEYLEKGIIEEAPPQSNYLTHYLPHRAIFQKGKIRVVYNASASSKGGRSMNSLVHKGPSLQENIVMLLVNFRINTVGITADIEKAYLQISLNRVDRDCVRFLWIKDLNKPAEGDNILYVRFARVPFGVNASPYLLNMVIQEHLSSEPANEWHLLAQKRFYVDNLVVSVNDIKSAVNLFNSLITKFTAIKMNLRDWASNSKEFVKVLPSNLSEQKEGPISILGIMWDRDLDSLSIKMNTNSPDTPTKRNVLKFLASIYDPLGLFSPCTLKLKIFMQSCWKNKYDWSEILPSHLEAEWLKLRSSLLLLPNISLPRRYWKYTAIGEYSLHIFCDASKWAYACCAYLTYYNPKTSESASTLMLSKVRLAPMKVLSMPRLELLALLIGKRLAVFIKNSLELSLNEIVLWTDATTVLQWINTSVVLPIFVHNRVSEIKRTPGIQIRYISGKQNPADIASRGEFPTNLQSSEIWWHGPAWLTCKCLWPACPENSEPFNTSAIFVISSVSSSILNDEIENKFSTWRKRVRIFEYVIKPFLVKRSISLTQLESHIMAEQALIRELQKKYFGKEYFRAKKVKLEFLDLGLNPPEHLKSFHKLDLFMDQNLLLRCKGRMQNASFPWDTIHPILLPRESLATRCYIRQLHLENQHIGCSHLLAKLRERFWVIKGRSLVKSVIHQCVGCRRWSGGNYQLPPMPALPVERVEEASPFLNVGIDYFGPIPIRNGNSTQTIHVAIFVCLVTRAIHLEIARDTTAIEFLRTLVRFVSIRGKPSFVLSDNAPNFVFIQPFVSDKAIITDRNLSEFCIKNGIRWKFIPHCSPWQGGAYERLIALVKTCFKKSYGNLLLDYVDLMTAMYQIMDTINSRPLTYVSSDEILSILTPNHFLRLRPVETDGSLEVTTFRCDSSARKVTKLWGHTKSTVENFWQAFRSLYLTSLRETHSAYHSTTHGSVNFSPRVGVVVLIKEEGSPRATWQYGKILSLDERNAVAIVQAKNGQLTRSINLLYPLELPSE